MPSGDWWVRGPYSADPTKFSVETDRIGQLRWLVKLNPSLLLATLPGVSTEDDLSANCSTQNIVKRAGNLRKSRPTR
jgi:hypothetical protein